MHSKKKNSAYVVVVVVEVVEVMVVVVVIVVDLSVINTVKTVCCHVTKILLHGHVDYFRSALGTKGHYTW